MDSDDDSPPLSPADRSISPPSPGSPSYVPDDAGIPIDLLADVYSEAVLDPLSISDSSDGDENYDNASWRHDDDFYDGYDDDQDNDEWDEEENNDGWDVEYVFREEEDRSLPVGPLPPQDEPLQEAAIEETVEVQEASPVPATRRTADRPYAGNMLVHSFMGHNRHFMSSQNGRGGGWGLERDNDDDLERAKILVSCLERLSNGLLMRMIRVGGAPGAYEDEGGEVNATGCAICCNPLLTNGKKLKQDNTETMHASSATDIGERGEIVSLPCAHVFHSSCLLPWFSRKTSCPTCRFDLDPHSLTRAPAFRAGFFSRPTPRPRADTPNSEDDDEDSDHLVGIPSAEAITEIAGVLLDLELRNSRSEVLSDDDRDPALRPGWAMAEESAYQPRSSALRPGWAMAEEESDEEESAFQAQSSHQNREWALPTAPGLSLRERIEIREREMGLRCTSATCIFAPSDEDPQCASSAQVRPQITVVLTDEKEDNNCKHTFHPACLVSETRVTGRGAPPAIVSVQESEDSGVEVECPSCRLLGRVSTRSWEEGIQALAENKRKC